MLFVDMNYVRESAAMRKRGLYASGPDRIPTRVPAVARETFGKVYGFGGFEGAD